MSKISQKVLDRFSKEHKKISKVIQSAKDRDINEADTVVIVNDVLSKVLGYDKYTEITREFLIRGTYCDLAVRDGNRIYYLVEVKAVGVSLQDKHIKQAVDYAANQGIDWVVLTNGVLWQVYKLRFEKPINARLVFSFNFLELNLKKDNDQQILFILSKEGIRKDAISEFSEYSLVVNKFYLSAFIQEEGFLNQIKKSIRKLLPKAKIESQELLNIFMTEVIKRDVIESDELGLAKKNISKVFKKQKKTTSNKRSAQVSSHILIDKEDEG